MYVHHHDIYLKLNFFNIPNTFLIFCNIVNSTYILIIAHFHVYVFLFLFALSTTFVVYILKILLNLQFVYCIALYGLESWLFPQVYRDKFNNDNIILLYVYLCWKNLYLVKLIYKTTHQLWGFFWCVFFFH